MTKNSNLGFSPSNSESQVLGSVDPLLIISEPPDLKNWFSSYEYRSPEFDTADGLEGCDSLIVNDSEEEEEVSYVEDSIKEKDEGLGGFAEQEFSDEDLKSSDEVEGNGFSEEGSFVEDSFKEKDENLGVFEEVGGLGRDECGEGETCVEDSIKLEGENLGEIGGFDSVDFVGCGGFKGNGCSEEDTYVEDSIKEKDENFGGFGELGNCETFVNAKVGSEGLVECENATKNNDMNQVADMSDTLNFSSEPPEIKNWFSSYVYESPALDTSDEFRLPSHEESTTPQPGLHIEMSVKSKEENVMETTITQNSDDLVGKKMASAGFVRTSSSAEDNSHDHWGNQKAIGIRNLSATNNLPLEGISPQFLGSNSASDSGAVSIKDVEFSDLKERDFHRKPKRKFPQNDLHNPFTALKSLGNGSNSPRKSLNRGDFVQKDSGGKAQSDNDMFVSPRSNLDFVASRRSSSRTDMSDDKENGKNDCAESGFISAKKNKGLRENDGNSLIRPPGASKSLRNGVKVRTVGNNDLNRRALTDRTNTQPSDVLGISGKWRCPQKSKPKLGPPMKQLGLERWVRRL
ncbi:hypothetical protein POM88_028514 [Heracleum sosnowskyi]|uniref:Uncharacterized protein n=1 Tax=Heracleum sosnowskyi TaxID=360622 RepID=A0AAD8HSD3_9APIA|nr:hypothetical protein POM88_028514 [Heracleum sosnowskyi]